MQFTTCKEKKNSENNNTKSVHKCSRALYAVRAMLDLFGVRYCVTCNFIQLRKWQKPRTNMHAKWTVSAACLLAGLLAVRCPLSIVRYIHDFGLMSAFGYDYVFQSTNFPAINYKKLRSICKHRRHLSIINIHMNINWKRASVRINNKWLLLSGAKLFVKVDLGFRI